MNPLRTLSRYFTQTTPDSPNEQPQQQHITQDDPLDMQARRLAERITSGFQLHDRRQRDEAIEAFHVVDRNQFAHLDSEEALRASEAFVESLWAKDEIEKSYHVNGEISPDAIAEADYDEVLRPLLRRAQIVGMDEAYAQKTTEAWHHHKTMEEYSSAFLEAQMIEVRAALGNPAYPDKPKEGRSGYGPLATRYLLAVELHDMHTRDAWEEAIQVMTPYYKAILAAHQGDTWP